MADRQVIKLTDGTLTIVDSSSAQKPGVDVPCPTRKQGCDNPQLNGQPETCPGSHNESMTPIEEKLLALCCKEANLSPESLLNEIASPDWSLDDKFSWRYWIDQQSKDNWIAFSAETKLMAFRMAYASYEVASSCYPSIG